MPRQHHQPERGEASGGGGKAVWDTGSSLYDSYELAAVRRLIDGSLAGVRSLPDEPPPPPTPAERQKDESKQQIVVASRARRGRKVTLRALFRAMASWAIRPRQEHACACVGIAPGGQVESVASSSHDDILQQNHGGDRGRPSEAPVWERAPATSHGRTRRSDATNHAAPLLCCGIQGREGDSAGA
ncbi:hypothetical protein EJB05_17785 [Eragrostis curvula]|uniref:Uncharacterized protein n=1 Tax=Eragrostis curvula TaxID=38414 RepID=A0A5J9VJD5_9POAL|nr:hypothetical protein EJB05_17785 [Eragrostis curvula]